MSPPPALLSLLLAAPAAPAQDDGGPPLANFYGFGELDILNVESRSDNLRAGDVDGDGRGDIYLADDSHSRLDLFLQRATPDPDPAADTADVNALPASAKFDHVKIPVDRAIYGLVADDFTGDGRTDLVYIGSPDRLVTVIGPEMKSGGEGGATGDAADRGAQTDWSDTAGLTRRELRLPDLVESVSVLAAGDLTGDGLTDLAVLGERVTYILRQTDAGPFAAPVQVRNTSEQPSLAQIADLDGDGLADLSYTARVGEDRVLAARLQQPVDGGPNVLGPELRFDLVDPRSVTLGDVFPEEPGAEVLAVTGDTGRLTVRKVRRPAAASADAGQVEDAPAAKLTQYGYGGRGDRDLAVGDVDGDGAADVVVSDPDGARVILFRQSPAGGLDLGTAYPSLAGGTQVRVGGGAVYVLSESEGVIGRSVWEDRRLTFPAPVEGFEDPVAFTLLPAADGGADGSGGVRIAAVTETGRRKYAIGYGTEETTAEVDLPGDPDRLEAADLDGDGAPELLLFPGRDKDLRVFDAAGAAPAERASSGLGPASADAGETFVGPVPPPAGGDGEPAAGPNPPGLLVARGNIARDLVADVTGDGAVAWTVRDQFNATEADAKVAGAVTLDVDGVPGSEVVLIDAGVNKLRVFARDGAEYAPAGEIDTGDFPYRDARVADLNADGRDDLLLVGEGRFAVLYAGRTDPKLQELATYETDLDRSYLADSLVGDVNGDGAADVVVLEVRSHHVEVLRAAGGELNRATYWKLFEEKNFDGEGGGGLQPREGAIADVTGDGRADLVLLVHDRVLIYPQDDGTAGDADAGATAAVD